MNGIFVNKSNMMIEVYLDGKIIASCGVELDDDLKRAFFSKLVKSLNISVLVKILSRSK